jgi:hypothetical protein
MDGRKIDGGEEFGGEILWGIFMVLKMDGRLHVSCSLDCFSLHFAPSLFVRSLLRCALSIVICASCRTTLVYLPPSLTSSSSLIDELVFWRSGPWSNTLTDIEARDIFMWTRGKGGRGCWWVWIVFGEVFIIIIFRPSSTRMGFLDTRRLVFYLVSVLGLLSRKAGVGLWN